MLPIMLANVHLGDAVHATVDSATIRHSPPCCKMLWVSIYKRLNEETDSLESKIQRLMVLIYLTIMIP